ncbi:META domain-containing protein [Flavobacterium sp. TSSA_36]|uniref:META domain-containing protein n=1 Tax=Flavobacterium sp. TSSA_36 TaxID=3447669 RepID=UPI003F3C5D3E
MLQYSGFLLVILLFLGCKAPNNAITESASSTKPTKAYQEQIENMEQGIYFRAMGNEPEWRLKISATQIEFTSLLPDFKSFTAPHIDPIRAMDANVKSYRLTTSTGTTAITIEQQKCTNTMSGQELPYTVRIEMTNNSTTSKTFSGCGYYVIDARLHDIWVLEKMNGENVSLNKFAKQLPYIEINSTNGTFMGYAGCNRMNGKLFFEKGLLRFTNISTTEMACEPQNRESELLHSLQSSTTYQVSNMRLTLTNPSGIELVFKKVD